MRNALKYFSVILFIFSGLILVYVKSLSANIRLGGGHFSNACFNCGTPAAPADPCATTTVAGTVCACGPLGGCTTFARYVGTFDVGGAVGVKKYMTTPADAPELKTWAPDAVNNLGARSTTDGLANTLVLEAKDPIYPAGNYCGTLTANGYSDWFLPSKDELNLLYTKSGDLGGFDLTSGYPASYYWSSTERSVANAWNQLFADGDQDNVGKNVTISVRCVRRY